MKARFGRTLHVLVPRSSQKECLEDLGLQVWKAGCEPAHLLQRHRNIRAQYQTAFLSLPGLHSAFGKKHFNISFNIPRLQSDHLSPFATDQQPRFPQSLWQRVLLAEEAIQRAFGRQPSSSRRPIKSTILDSRGGHFLVAY